MFSWFTQLKIAHKLAVSFSIVLVCMLGLGAVALAAAQTISATSTEMVIDAIPVNNAVRNILPDVINEETGVRAFMITGKEASLSAYHTGQQGLASDLALLASHYAQHPALRQLMEGEIKPELRPINAFYVKLIGQVRTGHIVAARAQINKAKALVHALRVSEAKVLTQAEATISGAHRATMAALSQMVIMVIGCTLGAIVLALLAAILLTRAIARPLQRLAGAAERLASGDVAVEGLLPAASRDEIGALSTSFRNMVAYQREMVDTAEAMAAGNLMHSVEPKGLRDLLGQSFAAMGANLRALIGQVAHSSEQVEAGAVQLAQATEQVGQASTQIARAIEDVARGTGEQSKSASAMIAHMTELSAAITQVVEGVSQQQTMSTPIKRAIVETRASLSVAMQSVATVTDAASHAATSAREGNAVVTQTVGSIEAVRDSVLQSAEQVAALGQRSQEIGQIVAAIDDIAEQTNLLALNAAIEAARAGEHGKGFAVVADEVRKLAERASNETKEITERIAAIQRQVHEVVAAMEGASAAVAQSAELGDQTRESLEGIVAMVESTRDQIQTIKGATDEIAHNVGIMSDLGEARNQIVAQTDQATEVMRVRAAQVSEAIESIAAVSEESAAGTEEVSASTEEQSAGVQEMSAGAQELSALAKEMQALVARFTLEANAPAPSSVIQRRAA